MEQKNAKVIQEIIALEDAIENTLDEIETVKKK